MDKDAYYFPHFYNARNDKKLKRVQKELGPEGYAIYFMILEVLRGEEGFKYTLEDIDLLADEFNSSEQKVRTVVCNYKLFQTNEKYFWSDKLIEFLKPYIDEKYKRKIDGIKGNLIKYKYITKTKLSKMTDLQVIEFNKNKHDSHPSRPPIAKKVNKSKVNKNKIKEKKVKYGEYKNVLLTDSEHQKLIDKFGKDGKNLWIVKMDEGIELKGYNYKSHYLAILKWSKNSNTTTHKKISEMNEEELEAYSKEFHSKYD